MNGERTFDLDLDYVHVHELIDYIKNQPYDDREPTSLGYSWFLMNHTGRNLARESKLFMDKFISWPTIIEAWKAYHNPRRECRYGRDDMPKTMTPFERAMWVLSNRQRMDREDLQPNAQDA